MNWNPGGRRELLDVARGLGIAIIQGGFQWRPAQLVNGIAAYRSWLFRR